MPANRQICIHGHFYQPPRENPWLEAVETQDSASPYHDWNERITAECYGPNASARILDEHDRILKIVNNYASISFNFGPTLLSWLESRSPDTYEAIIEADRTSRDRCNGHGNAIAQAYNHVILPLANARDKRTQVRWGLADFERRFGRKPEGMWLPETAVDNDSLEALLRAAAIVLRHMPGARFRIVGDGPMRASLLDLASSLGVAHAVDFLGHREDVPALLSDSDVLAFPSRTEAFPNGVIEGMAVGLPVVASAVGGILELVEDGRNGLLVPAGDVDALANALVQLLNDGDAAVRLARAARATIEARYSFDRMVASFEELYFSELATSRFGAARTRRIRRRASPPAVTARQRIGIVE